MTAQVLVRLISAADKRTFKKLGVRFGVSTGPADSYTSERFTATVVERLAALGSEQRTFRIARAASHGRPYVWFTAKSDLDAAMRQRVGRGRNAADVARDLLGLVHHGPISRESGGPNHLFAIHMPAEVASEATHMRPSAPQGMDNRRFVLQFAQRAAGPTDWGAAIDLEHFATRSTGEPVGARERVLLRLQASVLGPRVRLAFDYLGVAASSRGLIRGRDDDASFLKLVARGRDASKLGAELQA